MIEGLTYEERQERIKAEIATWADRYATVREAEALGFIADAYGNVARNASTILRPPTKFGYPAGGLAHPHHAGGPGEGARFSIFSHHDGTPDELRDQPVWAAGDCDAIPYFTPYRTRWGLTLPDAFARCIVLGEHHHQHFIVPRWIEGCPDLPVRLWRELLAIETEAPMGGQLDMFAPPKPPTQEQEAQRVIRQLVAGCDDEDRRLLRSSPGEVYGAERLIEIANRERVRRGVPDPEQPKGAPDEHRFRDLAAV